MTGTGPTVEITVNGERETVAGATTLGDLIAGLGIGRRGVAVAVDGTVIARSAWDTTVVAAGGRIEVLRAVQGG